MYDAIGNKNNIIKYALTFVPKKKKNAFNS